MPGEGQERRAAAGPGGFTLLELLIALAVFSLLAAMAYGGLRSVLRADSETAASTDRLKRLQWVFSILEQDLSQVVARGVRDGFGDAQPAMQTPPAEADSLELTRAGWLNPTGQERSTLQRVAYAVQDQTLYRRYWPVLDRAQDSRPLSMDLLRGVRALRLRFLDRGYEWRPAWPPETAGAARALPVAVEVVLELEDWGTIRRLYPLPGGAG